MIHGTNTYVKEKSQMNHTTLIQLIREILDSPDTYKICEFYWEDLGDKQEIRISYKELTQYYSATEEVEKAEEVKEDESTRQHFFPHLGPHG